MRRRWAPARLGAAVAGLLALLACRATTVVPPAPPSSGSPTLPAPAASPTPALPAPPSPSPAPSKWISPIQPQNRPTALPGASNGELGPAELIMVEGDCRAARAAAPSLARLLATARAEGISVGPNECYRPYVAQTSARSSACTSGNCACAGPPGHSMHGWGKAVDFKDASGSVDTFSSPTYRWLKQQAAQFGWNHPGWADPAGSPCPEPWHWEWVGDGGTYGAGRIKADVVGILPASGGSGYWILGAGGETEPRGQAPSFSPPPAPGPAALVSGGAATPSGRGFWLVSSDGGVFAHGDAAFLGSAVADKPRAPVTGIAVTPTGRGYWLVAADGRLWSFGDAPSFGSPRPGQAPYPVTGIASTTTGNGVWVVSAGGGVAAYGDASPPGPAPQGVKEGITGIAAAPGGKGFWLVSGAGQVFASGDAATLGPGPQGRLAEPVVGIAADAGGKGCWLVGADGGVFALGDAPFLGAGPGAGLGAG